MYGSIETVLTGRSHVGRTDGLSERARLEELGNWNALPPDPTTLVPLVEIPAPHLLRPEMADAARIGFLVRAYKAMAVPSKPHYRFYFAKPKNVLKHKQAPRLLLAAEIMIERKIPPAGWCAFSKWFYEALSGKDGVPAPTFCWSKVGFDKRAKLFEEHRDDFAKHQRVAVPLLRMLIEDYRAMWDTLMAKRPADRKGLLQIVDSFFPGKQYDLRIFAAREDTIAKQTIADQTAAEGGVYRL